MLIDDRLLMRLEELQGFEADGLCLVRRETRKHESCIYDEGEFVDAGDHDISGKVLMIGIDRCEARWRERSDYLVDLRFGSARDRAARWLAKRMGYSPMSTAPAWQRFTGSSRFQPIWCLAGSQTRVFAANLEHPCLAAVDATSTERLADGSLLCDAYALALVCSHPRAPGWEGT